MTKTNSLTEKDARLFLGVMIISLIGNVCADYALLWYGLSLLVPGDNTLTSFYVGQGVGAVVLSPLLAVLFDRFPRFAASVALDALYAGLLAAMGGLYLLGLLSTPLIFVFSSMVTAALSLLHKSSVGFAAVQRMSEASGVTDVLARFIAALNIPFLVGSALSGLVYHYLGFIGCMVIGIATFIPTPFIYCRVFGAEDAPRETRVPDFARDLKEGISALRSDRILYGMAMSVATLNVASAVLPSVVGFAFLQAFPGRTDYASAAISLSILGGILLTKRVGKESKSWPVRAVVPLSFVPAALALIVCLVYPNPFVIAVMFLLACIGSAARNVSSGSLRVSRVPKALIGRVNTAYSSLLYAGQAVGGFVIVKAVQNDLSTAALAILACFAAASVVSFILLPSVRVAECLEPSR
jgi:hypothetical protein